MLPLPWANIPEDISEAIDPDWITQLFHEYHPDYDGKVFVVKMTSRWGSTKPVFFLPSDLYDKKSLNKLTNELVNRRRFLPDEADALIKYVDYMKVAGPGMITPDDGSYKQHIMQTTDVSDEVDSEECYRQIVEYILDNGSVLPSQENNGFDNKWCHGAYLEVISQLRNSVKMRMLSFQAICSHYLIFQIESCSVQFWTSS